MTHQLPVDPELRLLLQEVANDPRARLFRTEIPRPTRLVLSEVPHVSLRAAGLTSAEREILRVYREDVAKLLRDAAEWKIRQDPLGAAETSEYSTATRRDPYADANEILASLDSHAARTECLISQNTVASTARRGRSLLATPNSTAHQLAGLSLRLVPHDASWVHIGRALVHEHKPGPALHAFSGVVRRQQAPRISTSSMTCIGAVLSSSNRHEDSALVYRAAAQACEPDPNTLLSWFAGALVAANGPLALESAEWIDAALPPAAPALQRWIAQLALRLQLDPPPPPSEAAQRLMRSLLERVGPSARGIIHELS